MSAASSSQPAMALPWLRPASVSLLALTDDPPDASAIRFDPGLVLHVLRYSRPTPDPKTFALDEATLCQSGLCETAAALLGEAGDAAPMGSDAHRVGQRLAHLGSKIATGTGLCSPDAAWVAGLLAPLGQYSGGDDNPLSLARKLLARWRLPAWLQGAVGYLDLPLDEAQGLGGHRGLNRVLRAAIRFTSTDTFPKFAREADEELDGIAERYSRELPAYVEVPDTAESELLPRLLRTTARARSRSAQSWIAPLEDRIDHLVGQLAEARLDFDHRLRDAKLEALSEFAAGASHEFNNPLAVISGNTQWLKAREADPDKAAHLGTILRQTQRIHDLLTGTRQFSSPSAAKPGVHSVEALLARVQRDFQSEADTLGIRIEVASQAATFLHVDGDQIRTAVAHLIRNALKAAERGGWIKLTSATVGSAVTISIEDSGPGVSGDAQEHLFDPFFSGRSAGRGRGLGLPIAWALARNNGGDVRWDVAHPTRFALSLPVREVPSRQVA